MQNEDRQLAAYLHQKKKRRLDVEKGDASNGLQFIDFEKEPRTERECIYERERWKRGDCVSKEKEKNTSNVQVHMNKQYKIKR